MQVKLYMHVPHVHACTMRPLAACQNHNVIFSPALFGPPVFKGYINIFTVEFEFFVCLVNSEISCIVCLPPQICQLRSYVPTVRLTTIIRGKGTATYPAFLLWIAHIFLMFRLTHIDYFVLRQRMPARGTSGTLNSVLVCCMLRALLLSDDFISAIMSIFVADHSVLRGRALLHSGGGFIFISDQFF